MSEYKIYKNKEQLIRETIQKSDVVLDVGFWGQGIDINDPKWPHRLIKNQAKEAYGVDIALDFSKLSDASHYFEMDAENFVLPEKFDVIFAGDLIEHLSNPGLFLRSCSRHLKEGGRLIITTPNAFNLFNLAEKLTKFEPSTNKDHTCYFNTRTIGQLLSKNGWAVSEFSFLYDLELSHKESFKKKFLNFFYFTLSKFTPKFVETLVVVAKRNI